MKPRFESGRPGILLLSSTRAGPLHGGGTELRLVPFTDFGRAGRSGARNGDVIVPHDTGLGALQQRPAREEAGRLFVVSWWAAMFAFSAVTWLLLITLFF